jgi:acyl-CoA reductase-like NAD-dependent aldehyde dehydrogenase
MLKKTYPYYLANVAVAANTDLDVTDKFSGEVATRVAMADAKAIDAAIGYAVAAQRAEALCIEAGKPINDSKGEVTRLIDTFRVAAEESVRIDGGMINLEIAPRAAGYHGYYKRVPIGPCSFISPFNFPLNLTAHKVAPAIAAGCPFVLKPASRTPVGALIMGEILAETDLPKGAFSILPAHRDGADLFTTDDRFRLLSFTGSPAVGWELKKKAGKKKVILELGGNAAAIVDRDQADRLDYVVDRLAFGAFYQSGQSCIGVQRILVHVDIYDALREKLIAKTKSLKMGDPKDENTFVGPMISESESNRLAGWMESAVTSGAKIIAGGKVDGAMFEATLLEGVKRDQDLYRKEAFGPVAILEKFTDFGKALETVNDSDFGLQAGVFTDSLTNVNLAWDELEVGGVVINDVPSFRVDNMPYGGVKDSGLGREGVKYAIEDMTELRLMVVRDAPKPAAKAK